MTLVNLILLIQSILIFKLYAFTSHQILTITKENNLNISFAIKSEHLPFPFRALMTDFRTQLIIKYSSINQFPLSLPSNSKPSISAFILNQTSEARLSAQLKEIIAGTFSFAINDRYLVYLTQTKQFYYSSPNDKFCVHHLEEIIRNFLPCRTNAGIAMLIDPSTLLFAKRLVEMNFIWTRAGVKIDLIISPIITFAKQEKKIKQVKYPGIKRLKISDRCFPYFQQFSLSLYDGAELSVNDIILDKLQSQYPWIHKTFEEARSKEIKQNWVNKQIIGQWYSPHKKLTYFFNLPSPNLSKLIIRQLLPPSCEPQSLHLKYDEEKYEILFKNTQICHQLQFQEHSQHSRDHNAAFQKFGPLNSYTQFCQIVLYIQNQRHYKILAVFQLGLKCSWLPFDQYESIHGGGQELPQIPVIAFDQNNSFHINVPAATIRVPLPDEGIPFIVMTLSLIVLAYMYLALWKNIKFRKNTQKNTNDKIKAQ